MRSNLQLRLGEEGDFQAEIKKTREFVKNGKLVKEYVLENVENEWGTIEEITLTYVVVQIWDQRRLVVPINYFLEHSFQNWTKSSAELIGAIFIYVDYGIPVDELRRELEKIVNASPLWDKRVANIQVTNATEKTMEIRALVSAENSSKTWELRCLVREKLIDFIQQNYPDKLPRLRLETDKNTDVKN